MKVSALLCTAALLAVPALPGCLEDAQSHLVGASCGGLDEPGPSGNAPLVPALAGPPREVAERFAAAVGDPITAVEPDVAPEGEGKVYRWDTETGRIEVFERPEGGLALVRFWSAETWTPADGSRAAQDVHALLAALGVPEETVAELDIHRGTQSGENRLDVETHQVFDGERVRVVGSDYRHAVGVWVVEAGTEMGDRSQVTLNRLYDLAESGTRLSWDEAVAAAEKAVRCDLEERGVAEEFGDTVHPTSDPRRFAVVNESLAYQVGVAYGEECLETKIMPVHVDAATGAVLRMGPEGAGCVY